MRKTLCPHVRLIVYSYLETKELLLKVTKLNKKENAKYLQESCIAGYRKIEVNLNVEMLCKQFKVKGG